VAQIFVSHSSKDKDLVNFFSNAFVSTEVKVKAVYEEFEKILSGQITPFKVIQDIENSNAVFVILSQNVNNILHTRDWVVWETGVAKNKDIWIFEPYPQVGQISVATPHLRHYVMFYTTDEWLGYIKTIIESYDDSHILHTVLGGAAGAAAGALAKKDKAKGAIWGGIGGAIATLAISDDKSKKRPVGLNIICISCHSTYNIHIPIQQNSFRCPVCNANLQIEMTTINNESS